MSQDGATITRLEKAAVDNGFDQQFASADRWLPFASTQAPLRIWLTKTTSEHAFVAAVSQQNVARALSEVGVPYGGYLPADARGARAVADIPALHHLLRRAFHLSRTLPDELLHTFIGQTAALPRTTEAERLVVQRLGQDIFRRGLLEYWEGRCAITGLGAKELLRASHIKPWADCESDIERLDVFNGFLLAPHLDAAFDAGLMTVADDATVLVSRFLSDEDCSVIGLVDPLRVRKLADEHCAYLHWHREKLFRDPARR
jgi:putative restriction endonuclease